MSPDEMREFCQRIQPFQLKVRVRLKNRPDVLVGRITGVEPERFQMTTDEEPEQLLRYAWVASITNG